MALAQPCRRLPARVAEHVPWAGGLDDGDVGVLDQLVERCGRLGVARIGEDLAVEVDAVPIAAHRAVVELDGLVPHARRRARGLRGHVAHLELRAHHTLPVGAPAHLPQPLQVLFDAARSHERQRAAVDEHPVEHEGRQSQRVVAVEVGEEDDRDVTWVHPEAMHVGQKRSAAVQQDAPVQDDRPVVAVQRESRTAPEEGELYATVTAWFRYTSWIACSNSMPSFIGRWNDLRPLIRPIPPARLLMTAVRTASFRSDAPLLSPPELISPARPM